MTQRIVSIVDIKYVLDVLALDRLVQERPGYCHVAAGLEPLAVVVLQIALDDRVEEMPPEAENVAGHKRLLPRAEKRIQMAGRAAAAVGSAPVAPDDFPAGVVLTGESIESVVGSQLVVAVENDHHVVAVCIFLQRMEDIVSLVSPLAVYDDLEPGS